LIPPFPGSNPGAPTSRFCRTAEMAFCGRKGPVCGRFCESRESLAQTTPIHAHVYVPTSQPKFSEYPKFADWRGRNRFEVYGFANRMRASLLTCAVCISSGVALHFGQGQKFAAICAPVERVSQCRQNHSAETSPNKACAAVPSSSGFIEEGSGPSLVSTFIHPCLIS